VRGVLHCRPEPPAAEGPVAAPPGPVAAAPSRPTPRPLLSPIPQRPALDPIGGRSDGAGEPPPRRPALAPIGPRSPDLAVPPSRPIGTAPDGGSARGGRGPFSADAMSPPPSPPPRPRPPPSSPSAAIRAAAAAGPMEGDDPVYSFRYEEEQFRLAIAPTATVLDAKERIAELHGTIADSVSLFLHGRNLKNEDLLIRYPIGSSLLLVLIQ
jgi:hypothetical protein